MRVERNAKMARVVFMMMGTVWTRREIDLSCELSERSGTNEDVVTSSSLAVETATATKRYEQSASVELVL